ncbi:hypothetical protein [Microbacterium gallinarum]|uniref:hypothetical protein n=1 Tax=Microbacterium gallinarum TaxID=2762209 RepID=UPI001CD895CC|nr:hypothetical protein [Microbacterium gallinarum]
MTVLTVVVTVPLAANSIVAVALTRWTSTIQAITTTWLAEEPGARVYDVSWSGADATVDVTTDDGQVPDIGDLQTALSTAIPSWVGVVVDVGQGSEYVVQ